MEEDDGPAALLQGPEHPVHLQVAAGRRKRGGERQTEGEREQGSERERRKGFI